MPDAIAYIYVKRPASTSFDELVKDFESCGLTLVNPASGRITAISETGDQVEVSRNWLASKIGSAETVGFQWWFDQSTDLYCRFRFTPDVLVEEYALDGLGEKLTSVKEVLIGRFRKLVRNNSARGLVLDTSGVTEGYDWDDFFLGRSNLAIELPDVLGIERSDADRIEIETNQLAVEQLENGMLLI